ncbi:ABC transporter permease [Kytococcus sp. Marseille-QA3725]
MAAVSGLGRAALLGVRTGWRGLVAWVVGLLALMAMTAGSVATHYDTPEALDAYARMTDAPGMAALSGDVAGVDTLGGAMANEFGQVAAFAVPLMAVALVVRGTRGEEQSGRTALLLAGTTGRLAPLAAALGTALAALAVVGFGSGALMAVFGADRTGAVHYGLGLALLGAVHVGVAALLAQALGSTRSVWAASMAVVVVGFLLRGIGAVEGGAWGGFSPVGWLDAVRSYGQDTRWWPLLVSLGVAVCLVAAALVLGTRRDVGASLVRPRPGPARAGAALRSPIGLALHEHRGAILGWVVGAAVLMGAYGALTRTMIEALEEMPELQVYLGGGGALVDSVAATFLMMLGTLAVACVVQTAGGLWAGEATGLLERQLAGPRGRWTWLAAHGLVVLGGALLVVAAGGAALAGATAVVTEEPGRFGDLFAAAFAQLPVVVFFLGVVTLLLGWLPEHRGLAWAVFAVAVAVGWLGPGLDLPQWTLEAGPFTAVGQVPAEALDRPAAVVLVVLGVVLVALGAWGFRRRDLPRA